MSIAKRLHEQWIKGKMSKPYIHKDENGQGEEVIDEEALYNDKE